MIKKDMLHQIDQAIANLTNKPDDLFKEYTSAMFLFSLCKKKRDKDYNSKLYYQGEYMKLEVRCERLRDEIGYIEFLTDTGRYKILNHPDNLERFRKAVEKNWDSKQSPIKHRLVSIKRLSEAELRTIQKESVTEEDKENAEELARLIAS